MTYLSFIEFFEKKFEIVEEPILFFESKIPLPTNWDSQRTGWLWNFRQAELGATSYS